MHDRRVVADSEGFRLAARSLLTRVAKVGAIARAAEIAFCAAVRAIRQRSKPAGLAERSAAGQPRA